MYKIFVTIAIVATLMFSEFLYLKNKFKQDTLSINSEEHLINIANIYNRAFLLDKNNSKELVENDMIDLLLSLNLITYNYKHRPKVFKISFLLSKDLICKKLDKIDMVNFYKKSVSSLPHLNKQAKDIQKGIDILKNNCKKKLTKEDKKILELFKPKIE